jgi:hypothetical protein
MTTNILLAIFVYFLIPETKGAHLEEVDVLFGGANHTEKGGDLLHIEDPHHAHLGVDNAGHDKIESAAHAEEVNEIKM